MYHFIYDFHHLCGGEQFVDMSCKQRLKTHKMIAFQSFIEHKLHSICNEESLIICTVYYG